MPAFQELITLTTCDRLRPIHPNPAHRLRPWSDITRPPHEDFLNHPSPMPTLLKFPTLHTEFTTQHGLACAVKHRHLLLHSSHFTFSLYTFHIVTNSRRP